MGLIVNIETSASVCSVCLAKDGNIVDFCESKEVNSHARLLTVLIDKLLSAANLSFRELDAVAVSSGPGSYTGLRIGVSAAKGLCYVLDKPLISVPTLLSIAEGIKQATVNQQVCFMPVIDARRMDVYTVVYNSIREELLPTKCVTINAEFEESLAAFGDIYIGGNALAKCKGVFKSPQIQFVENIDCDSRLMASLAENKYCTSTFEDMAYFEPVYLKEFLLKSAK